jgi:hypothetical protein
MTAKFTAAQILGVLDRGVIESPYCFFMDLEHGYFYTANSRLTLYADNARWGIAFEKNGYANRGGRIELELNFFGNCLMNLDRGGADDQFACNAKYHQLVDGAELEAKSADFELLALEAGSLTVRDRVVSVPTTLEGYERWVPGITQDQERARPTFEDLGRFLAFEYADICCANDKEKRQCLPADLPELMTIDAWHHRSYSYFENGDTKAIMGDVPSSYETWPLIADVLVNRDPRHFRPTLPPNNHWSNWPEAGGL